MSKQPNHFSMGAVNKKTLEYVFPIHASKSESYICPTCKTDVVFRSGEINRKHFAHSGGSGCGYYNCPTESELHKTGKRLIKKLIDDKQSLIVYRHCRNCHEDKDVFSVLNWEYTDGMNAIEEFPFTHNSRRCFGDVVLTDGPDIKFIFEVIHTHRTMESARPSDRWGEFKASQLINNTMDKTNITDNGELRIECSRNILCDKCEKQRLEIIQMIEQQRLECERLNREQQEAEIARENRIKKQMADRAEFEKTARKVVVNKFKPDSILVCSRKNGKKTESGKVIEFGKKTKSGTKIQARILADKKIKINNRFNNKAIDAISAWRQNGYKLRPSLDDIPFVLYEIKYEKLYQLETNEIHITEILNSSITSADYKYSTAGVEHSFYELFAAAEIDDIENFSDDEYENVPLELDDLIGNMGYVLEAPIPNKDENAPIVMEPKVSPFTVVMANKWLSAGGKDVFNRWFQSEKNSRSALSEETEIQKDNKFFLHDVGAVFNTDILSAEHYCLRHNITV